jgi:hypothetical protein
MDDFYEVWALTQKLSGVVVIAALALYVFRCLVTFSIVTLPQFGHFLNGLAHFLCA